MQHNIDIKTLGDLTTVHALERGDKTAFVCGERSESYGEFNLHCNSVANGLISEGLVSQSRVVVLDKNSEWFFEILFGAAKIDCVLVGINWRLAAKEMAYIINDSQAEILFVGEEFLPLIDQISSELPLVKKILLMTDASQQDEQKNDRNTKSKQNNETLTSYVQWRDQSSDTDPLCEVSPSNVVVQMYTSGTTGMPKGVMLSHENFMSQFRLADNIDPAEHEWNIWSDEDCSLVAMPSFHIGGVGWAFLGLYAGAKNVVLREFIPAETLKCFRDHSISKIFLVPAAMQLLLMDPACAKTDFSSMKYIIYGASPIPLSLLQQAMDVFQCEFVQLYGLTECTAIATYLPAADHDPKGNKRMQSAGKARPGVEIEIRKDGGGIAEAGDVGEICIQSTANMVGYWNMPEATDKTLVDGWILSGDAGYMDEDGYLYLYDRIKDMIVSGGENIYPAEIESALFAHDSIADLAVIGVPDEKWGEAVKAVVVLKPDNKASERDIIDFAREHIAGFKVPKSVDFVETLPRNPSGKLLKKDIRAPYWQGRKRQIN